MGIVVKDIANRKICPDCGNTNLACVCVGGPLDAREWIRFCPRCLARRTQRQKTKDEDVRR